MSSHSATARPFRCARSLTASRPLAGPESTIEAQTNFTFPEHSPLSFTLVLLLSKDPFLSFQSRKCSVMALKCAICGKGPHFGNVVSHANNTRRRRWNPNLKRVSGGGRSLQAGARVHRLHPFGPCEKSSLSKYLELSSDLPNQPTQGPWTPPRWCVVAPGGHASRCPRRLSRPGTPRRGRLGGREWHRDQARRGREILPFPNQSGSSGTFAGRSALAKAERPRSTHQQRDSPRARQETQPRSE